jgi:hypothetical protein
MDGKICKNCGGFHREDQSVERCKELVKLRNLIIERQEKNQCIHCGMLISDRRQVGRCIYADPCGCRQGQGTLKK